MNLENSDDDFDGDMLAMLKNNNDMSANNEFSMEMDRQ